MERANLSKALYDVGKFTFAAIVLGQFLSLEGLKVSVFIGALIFWIGTFIATYLVDEEQKWAITF